MSLRTVWTAIRERYEPGPYVAAKTDKCGQGGSRTKKVRPGSERRNKHQSGTATGHHESGALVLHRMAVAQWLSRVVPPTMRS